MHNTTSTTPLGRLLLAIGNERDNAAAGQVDGEEQNTPESEQADTIVDTLDGILTEAFTSGHAFHDAPLILVVGQQLAQMLYDGLELLQPDTSHAQACRLSLLRQFSEYLEKRRAMVDASSFPAAPTVVEAARAVVHQRDYYAEHGHYDTSEPNPADYPDGCFDDWAADILEQSLRTDGQPSADPLTPEERALHVCEVQGCDRIPEAGSICNECAPGAVADPAAMRLVIAAEALLNSFGGDVPDWLRTEAAELGKALEPYADEAVTVPDSLKGSGPVQHVSTPAGTFDISERTRFELRSGGPLSDEARAELRKVSPLGKALATLRRDAQDAATAASDTLEHSRGGRAMDLGAIDRRVDFILSGMVDIFRILDGLAAVVEERK